MGLEFVQENAALAQRRYGCNSRRVHFNRFDELVVQERERRADTAEAAGANPAELILASVTQQKSSRLLSGMLGVQVPPGA